MRAPGCLMRGGDKHVCEGEQSIWLHLYEVCDTGAVHHLGGFQAAPSRYSPLFSALLPERLLKPGPGHPVHRDFKPANVLVGTDGRPRVTDFGLVRHGPGLGEGADGEPGEAERSLTRAGAVAGTPAYMAPEQLAGREVDARADQFSV